MYTHQRPVLNEYLKCKSASVYFCLKNMKNTYSSKSGQCINKLKKKKKLLLLTATNDIN